MSATIGSLNVVALVVPLLVVDLQYGFDCRRIVYWLVLKSRINSHIFEWLHRISVFRCCERTLFTVPYCQNITKPRDYVTHRFRTAWEILSPLHFFVCRALSCPFWPKSAGSVVHSSYKQRGTMCDAKHHKNALVLGKSSSNRFQAESRF